MRTGSLILSAWAALAVALSGCSDSPSIPAPSKPLLVVDAKTAGTLQGVVLFDGLPPETTRIPVDRFPECRNPKTIDDDILVHDSKVENAFVYVQKGLEAYSFPPATREVVLDQIGCLYHPRVLGLQVGQPLVIRNSDPLLHNVHAQPKVDRGFNFGMQNVGEIRKSFDQPEVMVPIRCDVHPWMRAYVGVLPHSYFSVTGKEGQFEIPNLPPGTYTIEVWHERLGQRSVTVTVPPHAAVPAVTIRLTR